MREEALLFGKAKSLVGIITDPPPEQRSKGLPGILLLNAGIIHHVGPNRIHVKIARSMAALGFVVLRFDFSGIGDSKVRDDNLPFAESAVRETQEAMDYLSATRGVERFHLIGISSGAIVSYKAAGRDARVIGATLINPASYGEELRTYAKSRRYWKNALADPKRWLKALTGKANYRIVGPRLRSMFASRRGALSVANEIASDFRSLMDRRVDLRLVYSQGDLGLDCLDVILGKEARLLSTRGKLKLEVIPQADHTCTLLESQQRLVELVQDCAWATARANGTGAQAGALPHDS
jgi:pimeloyl-ACP methyl ester carboxylesterase